MRAKNKVIIFYLFVSVITALFLPAQAGYAQQQTFTETPSATESPVSMGNIDITETATPVETEVGVPSTAPVSEPESTRRILVRISSNARLENVMARMEAFGRVTENSQLAKLGVFIMDVPDGNFDEKLVELRNISGVGYVEPDYPVQAVDTIPNDPSFPSQYGLTAIRAPQGWDLSTGSSAVTIAILDSGVDLGHPDLAGGFFRRIPRYLDWRCAALPARQRRRPPIVATLLGEAFLQSRRRRAKRTMVCRKGHLAAP